MASLLGPGGVGSRAPALDLSTSTGERRKLEDFKGRPTLVSFLGPAHCVFCRAHVIRMIQARDEFDRLGAGVIFVAYHDPALLTAKMLHDLELPYTLLLDPTRATYTRWGLKPAGLRNMLPWGTLKVILKLMLRIEPSMGTIPGQHQLGGDFVVDPAGRLVLVNRMKAYHDRVTTPDLLAALRACAVAPP